MLQASLAVSLVAGGLAAGADGLGAVVAVSLKGLQVLLALSKVVLGLLRCDLGIHQLVAAVRQVPYTNKGEAVRSGQVRRMRGPGGSQEVRIARQRG